MRDKTTAAVRERAVRSWPLTHGYDSWLLSRDCILSQLLDPAAVGADPAAMALSTRNQDIYKAVLALISGDIKSNPRLRVFRKTTNEPLKLSGMGKLTVPGVVWEMLKDDDALTAEWDVSIEEGQGTSAEFTMNKR